MPERPSRTLAAEQRPREPDSPVVSATPQRQPRRPRASRAAGTAPSAARLPVARIRTPRRRPECRRRAPAVVFELVGLLLLDEQARGGEQRVPAVDVVEPEPAVVARLAERDGDEQPAARAQHAAELAERVDA